GRAAPKAMPVNDVAAAGAPLHPSVAGDAGREPGAVAAAAVPETPPPPPPPPPPLPPPPNRAPATPSSPMPRLAPAPTAVARTSIYAARWPASPRLAAPATPHPRPLPREAGHSPSSPLAPHLDFHSPTTMPRPCCRRRPTRASPSRPAGCPSVAPPDAAGGGGCESGQTGGNGVAAAPHAAVDRAAYTTDGRQVVSVTAVPPPPGAFRASVGGLLDVATPTTMTLVVVVHGGEHQRLPREAHTDAVGVGHAGRGGDGWTQPDGRGVDGHLHLLRLPVAAAASGGGGGRRGGTRWSLSAHLFRRSERRSGRPRPLARRRRRGIRRAAGGGRQRAPHRVGGGVGSASRASTGAPALGRGPVSLLLVQRVVPHFGQVAGRGSGRAAG
ncbi:hypothetical protein BU14_0585s0010, partial [Porphyra umbilicalis]